MEDGAMDPIELDPPGWRVSYAQNGEDVRLWRALDCVQTGFFVEVGGWEPEVDSASRSFYGRGWSGVVVEPVPEYASRFRSARPRDRVFQVLAGAEEGSADFTVFPSTGLSTTVPDHALRHIESGLESRHEVVPVRPMDHLLKEAGSPNEIHFMTIDVEGAEEAVIRGLALTDYRPWILLVEATVPRSSEPCFDVWEHLLLDKGYRFVAFDGLNRFYVAEEHAELGEQLQLPPNTLDNFQTIHQVNAMQEIERAYGQRDESNRALARRIALDDAKLELLQARLDAANASLGATVAEVQALQAQLSAIVSSRSWRLTRPLRTALGKG